MFYPGKYLPTLGLGQEKLGQTKTLSQPRGHEYIDMPRQNQHLLPSDLTAPRQLRCDVDGRIWPALALANCDWPACQ